MGGGPVNEFHTARRAVRVIASIVLASALLALGLLACGRNHPKRAAAGSVEKSDSTLLSPASVEEAGYLFTPAERIAVDEFLRGHTDLRIATDSDRRGLHGGDGDVRGLYGVYHPYFVRGDVNDDGILDFILGFVHRGSEGATPWFSVVVFTGRGQDRGYRAGTLLERDVSLCQGDLSIDRDAILITPDLSDEGVRRYRWDPVHRSYVFVRDEDDDEDDMPLPAQT